MFWEVYALDRQEYLKSLTEQIRTKQKIRTHMGKYQAGAALVQLQHRQILRLHLRRLGQQRVADVSAQMDGTPRFFQQGGNDGRSGGLTVAAGNSQHRARTDLEKDLHF